MIAWILFKMQSGFLHLSLPVGIGRWRSPRGQGKDIIHMSEWSIPVQSYPLWINKRTQ